MTLPDDFIDPEHTGRDRELLRTFYEACHADGGTADEITLRGIRAVLAFAEADSPAAVALAALTDREVAEMVEWLEANRNEFVRPSRLGAGQPVGHQF